jgi:ankyrin repeat protein
MGLMMRVRFVRRRLKARMAVLAVALASLTSLVSAAPSLPATGPDAVSFFRAAQVDDARSIKPILARGLDPNLREPENGETGMIVALRHDAMRVFQLLLSQPNIQLETTADNGNTALMMASFKKNKDAVLALLAKGAQVNRPGWTALHYAAAAGDTSIMRILLDHHAYIDAESPTGVTPLMLAAREGMEDAVKLLLAEGADASLKDRGFKSTAAEFADRADKPWISEAIRSHMAAAKR